jgi:hypothetical protein
MQSRYYKSKVWSIHDAIVIDGVPFLFINTPPPIVVDPKLTAETAFLKPVNVRATGWTYHAEYCLRLLREQGVRARDIALRLGCSQRSIDDRCRKLQLKAITRRNPNPKPPKTPKPRRVGVGHCRGASGLRQMMISFDEDTFAEIRRLAETEKSSFAEQVRILVQWGLDSSNPPTT